MLFRGKAKQIFLSAIRFFALNAFFRSFVFRCDLPASKYIYRYLKVKKKSSAIFCVIISPHWRRILEFWNNRFVAHSGLTPDFLQLEAAGAAAATKQSDSCHR